MICFPISNMWDQGSNVDGSKYQCGGGEALGEWPCARACQKKILGYQGVLERGPQQKKKSCILKILLKIIFCIN